MDRFIFQSKEAIKQFCALASHASGLVQSEAVGDRGVSLHELRDRKMKNIRDSAMDIKKNLRELSNSGNHYCFGCSPINAHGLRMKFFTDDKALFSWLKVPGHLCGWDNLVHGGVLATILDEAMGWTAIHFLKRFALTHSMALEFNKSVHIGEEVRVEARVLEVRGSREATVEGFIYKGEDTLCAKSTGAFRLFTAQAMLRLGMMDEEALKRFDFLIEP